MRLFDVILYAHTLANKFLWSEEFKCAFRVSKVGSMVVSHLLFADDSCLFVPSLSDLQCLVDIWCDSAAEHEIVFNCHKTVGVVFPLKV